MIHTCKINVLFVCFTYAHVEYIKCTLQSLIMIIQTVKEERRVLRDVYDMSRVRSEIYQKRQNETPF
jgi:heme exporter protein D